MNKSSSKPQLHIQQYSRQYILQQTCMKNNARTECVFYPHVCIHSTVTCHLLIYQLNHSQMTMLHDVYVRATETASCYKVCTSVTESLLDQCMPAQAYCYVCVGTVHICMSTQLYYVRTSFNLMDQLGLANPSSTKFEDDMRSST